MTHDYHALITTLSRNLELPPEQQETISPEAYQYVIDTLLFKLFDRDYLDEVENTLIKTLPELVNQPYLSVRYISPEFLSYLHKHPQNIEDFYSILRTYLALKIENLQVLSADEQFIVSHIPELDEAQIMTLPITSDFLMFAAQNLERLTSEQIHCLFLYLNAKILDRQALTEEEENIFDHLSSTIDVDNEFETEFLAEMQTEHIPSAATASFLYGYDIYDFSALIQRLESTEYSPRQYHLSEPIEETIKLPLSEREIRVIKSAWGFDPSDEAQRLQILQPYWEAQDVLDPSGSHEKYVARMQRFRERA